MTARMARAAPWPRGSGAVKWYMSAVEPQPSSSAQIRAPRARACSISSKTMITEPSPMMNPSRFRSKGRDAPGGIVIALAHRSKLTEGSHQQGGYGGPRPPRDHRHRVPAADHLRGVAQGVPAGGAGADHGVVGAPAAALDGD